MSSDQVVIRDHASDVRFITDDLVRFWQAFDQAQNASDPTSIYQRQYLEPGSIGLQDFSQINEFDANSLAKVVASYTNFFAAIRHNTLALTRDDRIQSQIKTHFENLKHLYPPAQFQDVYFVIGALNSGGTVSANGLLMGTEINARDASTPIEELSPWLQANTGSLEGLVRLVVHEAAHTLQHFTGTSLEVSERSLLWKALMEGGADFMTTLATSQEPPSPFFKYGLEHEHDLWQEFSSVMLGTDISEWIYNGDRSTSRPADLGYFIGYRILEAYYNRMPDKQKAIAEMLAIRDPEKVLQDSGYNP
jgi:Predicted Zn-dependent protease (DUF2268)